MWTLFALIVLAIITARLLYVVAEFRRLVGGAELAYEKLEKRIEAVEGQAEHDRWNPDEDVARRIPYPVPVPPPPPPAARPPAPPRVQADSPEPPPPGVGPT